MYGRILRHLRIAKGLSQSEVARRVGMSAAHLARLESSQRGLYLEDFVLIVEALGEKPGNLLPNDVGAIGHLKPLVDRLASVKAEYLDSVSDILHKLVLLTEDVGATARPGARGAKKAAKKPARKARASR
ncbi:MAG TPA: helix-turn-helix transcriptional regulator [Thermoanaerobaculia bacterium]|nr:helix-turn-helix transcriptional regulator [Thermoanaerobaculia bacterium]